MPATHEFRLFREAWSEIFYTTRRISSTNHPTRAGAALQEAVPREAAMLDISSATVGKTIVHRIGNKGRDEGYTLSQREMHDEKSIDELLLRHFLPLASREQQGFTFHHESDIALNALHKFATQIFSASSSFRVQSQNIAKHLYSVSTHPNIAAGELIIVLFKDVRLDERPNQALGIFRIESKDSYFDVEETNGVLQLKDKAGIAVDRIQKGAIVLEEGPLVFAVDTSSSKSKYWMESFLKVTPRNTPSACAKVAGELIKAVSKRISDPASTIEFNTKLGASVAEGAKLSMKDIRSIATEYVESSVVDSIFQGISDKSGISVSDKDSLDSKVVTKYADSVTKRVRVAESIELVVSNRNAHVSGLVVKKTAKGFKATIDIEMQEEAE